MPHALPTPLPIPRPTLAAGLVTAVLVLLAPGARADCLTGVGSTGLAVGPLTAGASTPFATPPSDFKAQACAPQGADLETGEYASGLASSSVAGDQNGMGAAVIVSVPGEAWGSSSASGSGFMEIVFEVQTLPGYAGPSTISLPIDVGLSTFQQTFVTGANSSAGGTSNGSLTIEEVGGLATLLASITTGAQEGSEWNVVPVMASVDVDTPYVLTASISVHGLASSAKVSQEIEFASISRSAAVSFGVDGSGLDPDLQLVFPMTSTLGLPAPAVQLPPAVPIGPLVAPLSIVAFGAMASRRLRRLG